MPPQLGYRTIPEIIWRQFADLRNLCVTSVRSRLERKVVRGLAAFEAEDAEIIITRRKPWTGRSRAQAMAASSHADVPDLSLTCDEVRCFGSHVICVWTFTGHYATTGKPLKIRCWEERELNDNLKVQAHRDGFDADN